MSLDTLQLISTNYQLHVQTGYRANNCALASRVRGSVSRRSASRRRGRRGRFVGERSNKNSVNSHTCNYSKSPCTLRASNPSLYLASCTLPMASTEKPMADIRL